MTPDQQFARLVKIASGVFVVLFGYFLFADAMMPLTPQAMVTRTITKVAPQISGKVTNIAINNNQAVQTGYILFEIEPTSYLLAVEQARLALEQAQQENAELDAALQAAEAGVKANQTIANQKHIIAKRLDKLYSTQGISQQLVDQADSEAATADANLLAAQARLEELKVHRGNLGENNLKLRQAQNQLEQAKLNLTYTQIKADHNGVVTNLQLVAGSFAKAGQPLIALVSDKIDIVADFREKSLRGISTDTQALIAFDADPGRLYPAYVSTVDAGVSAAQFDANGLLAAPLESDRWVRDAQRIRIHLQLIESPDYSLAAGARVTVQLIPDNKVLRFFARLQIKLISLLHYIY